MKFKKDWKVFEDIQKARMYYCKKLNTCAECVFDYAKIRIDCYFPCKEDPIKASQLMGFEVIEDEDDKMELPLNIGSMTLAQAKYYCRKNMELLGGECKLGDKCKLADRKICGTFVFDWVLDGQLLTQEELEICRALGEKWVSKSGHKCSLWSTKPFFDKVESVYISAVEGYIATVSMDKFPSVKPGDCISVEEVL